MAHKTPTQKPSLKAAQDSYEARQKKKGWTRTGVWIPKDSKPKLHAYAKKLRNETKWNQTVLIALIGSYSAKKESGGMLLHWVSAEDTRQH